MNEYEALIDVFHERPLYSIHHNGCELNNEKKRCRGNQMQILMVLKLSGTK